MDLIRLEWNEIKTMHALEVKKTTDFARFLTKPKTYETSSQNYFVFIVAMFHDKLSKN